LAGTQRGASKADKGELFSLYLPGMKTEQCKGCKKQHLHGVRFEEFHGIAFQG
jgi:hypothetical protein